MIYFGWHGALGEFLNACLIHPVKYGAEGQPHLHTLFFNLLKNLEPVSSLAVAAGMGMIAVGMTRVRAWKNGLRALPSQEGGDPSLFDWVPLVALWLFFDLAGALAGGRNYPHYFLTLTPSLSVAAGLSYWLIFSNPNERKTSFRAPRIAVFSLILGPVLFLQGLDLKEIGYRMRNKPQDRSPISVFQVVDYLNLVQRDGDTLFVWDYLPQIYFRTGMDNASRFTTAVNLEDFIASPETIGKELLSDLKQRSPSYIVDHKKKPMPPDLARPVYEEFLSIIEERYELTHVSGDLHVYNLIGTPPPFEP